MLFDGDPNHDGPGTLWQLAADEGVTWFGVGSPFITASRRSGIVPGEQYDLSALRAVGATGAPLPSEGFRWIYEAVSPDVMLSPISGGTDVCSAFVGGSPMTPVWEGEIPCRYLGAAVEAFDEDGHSVVGEQGELVITQPMPSMPVGFWGDADGSRYRPPTSSTTRASGVTVTGSRSPSAVGARSPAVPMPPSIAVGCGWARPRSIGSPRPSTVSSTASSCISRPPTPPIPGTLVLFVVLADGAELDDPTVTRIRSALRTGLSPRHVPDEVRQLRPIPTTLSGKKLELPVKKILLGADPEAVASRGALKDPSALDAVAELAATAPREMKR